MAARRHCGIAAALGLCLLSGPHTAYALSPNGSQFQVNTLTTNGQTYPSVAIAPAGNFLVVWDSAAGGGAGSDNSSHSIQGQRYDASGSLIGGQFQVNTYASGEQSRPSVASDSAGNFVVVWQSYGSAGSDTSDQSVQGQRYNASGAAIGGEFQVNTYTTSTQNLSSVASDANGNFVVVWTSQGSYGSDTSMTSVQGQRYSASGAAIGGQFQVNTYTTSTQSNPWVASDSAGTFLVVWTSLGSAGGDTSGHSVQGQLYDAGGPVGGQFQVNSYTTSVQYRAAVASDSSGDFVVVWQSFGSADGDTSSFSMQGRPYYPSSGLGTQFQVNTYTTGAQYRPVVASNSAGTNFVVAWTSIGSPGNDTSYHSAQAQRYLPEPPFAPSLGVTLLMAVVLARARSRPRSVRTRAGANGDRTRAA